MPQSAQAIEIVKQAINSRDNVKIELAGEEFNTRIIHFDDSVNSFIADKIMPKYGDNRLMGEQAYLFKQSHYKDGVINQLEFIAIYQKSVEFNGIPAHLFNLPHEIIKKSTFFDIKPKSKDEIKVRFTYRFREYGFKVSRMNIQNIYFIDSEEKLNIAPKGVSIKEGYVRMTTGEAKIAGILYQEAKYDFRLELRTISPKDHLKLGEYIDNEYRSLMGFERLNYPDEPAPPKTLKKPSDTADSRGKIFIVDNDLLATDLLSRSLNAKGYQCFVYNDGVNLIDIAQKQRPDLVILAIRLPVYDGLTLLRRLKKNIATSSIPVVMFTHSANKEDVLESNELGAAFYFIKSADMDMEEFTSKIEAII